MNSTWQEQSVTEPSVMLAVALLLQAHLLRGTVMFDLILLQSVHEQLAKVQLGPPALHWQF